MQKIFGDRRFNKEFIALAIPIMFQCLIMTAINTVDTFMMGSIGDNAVGAVATVTRYTYLINAVVTSVVGSCTVYLAQYYGGQKYDKTKEIFRIAIILTVLFILPFFLLALFAPRFVISLFNNSPDILDPALTYIGIIRFSELFLAFSIVVSNSLHAIGNTKTPMYVNIFVAISKILLNFLLLKVFKLNIMGAALSTLIVRFFEMAMYVVILIKNDFCFETKLKDLLKFDRNDVNKIMKMAIPFTINNFLYVFGMSMFYKLFSISGDISYNSYAIATSFHDVFLALDNGLCSASSIVVSQELGTGKLDEALKKTYYTYGIVLVSGVLIAIGEFMSSGLLPIVYSASSAEVISYGTKVLRIQSMTIILYMLSMNNYSVFKAGGDTNSIFMMDSGIVWIVQLPIIAFFVYYVNADIVILYLSSQIGEVVKVFLSFFLFSRKRWLKNLVA